MSQAKDSPVIIDEVFVEEVEEIEETTEDQIHEDTQEREFQTPDNRDETMLQSNPAPKDTLISEDYSGKTQLEILELELRARAIQSLMKATKAGSIKNAPKWNVSYFGRRKFHLCTAPLDIDGMHDQDKRLTMQS